MIRAGLGGGRIAAAFGLATALAIAPAFGARGPLRTWSIDFADPVEAGRWRSITFEDLRRARVSDQIRWRQAWRPAPGAPQRRALEVAATSDLAVETAFALFRPFPPGFAPDPGSDLILAWDWMIGDIDTSDAVTLEIVYETADGIWDEGCGAQSHSRLTIGWQVLFDPANQWRHHRLILPGRSCRPPRPRSMRPAGVLLHFLRPVLQVVSLASLRIEEWPADSLGAEPHFQPHRIPPPAQPFEEVPVDRLRHATAGALEDLDGDGLPELLVLERRGYLHLYRNRGHRSFAEDITSAAGLAIPTLGTGAMFLDLDADRDKDLVVTGEFDVPRLFENLGGLRFRERPPLADRHLSFWYGAAAEDVDRDGRPDLLFVSPVAPLFLYLRNQGGWDFRPEPPFSASRPDAAGDLPFSVSFGDFDGDRRPDLFLGRERLFHNRAGRLTLVPAPWTPMENAKTEGGVWADWNGDGRLDLLVLRDRSEAPTGHTRLLLGDGRGGFADATAAAGLPPLDSAEAALAEDFDNDGDLDLFLCQHDRPKYLLLNDGHAHFTDSTDGSGFTDAGGCDSALAGDLDGDGAIDVIILRYGAPPAFLYNQLPRGLWLGASLAGRPPATDALGARVQLLDPATGAVLATRFIRRGQGFGSVGPLELRFGLGSRSRVDLEVFWPGGTRRLLRAVPAGRTVSIHQEAPGPLGGLARTAAEALDPGARTLRRLLLSHPEIRWLAAGLAAVVFVGGIGLGLRRRRAPNAPAEPLADLIRFLRDFRHAGLEARALVSIALRVQNLFLGGPPNPSFLEALHRQTHDFPDTTGERLAELVRQVTSHFPDLPEAGRLAACRDRLESLLAELPDLGEDPARLVRWRDQALPAVEETQRALTALLDAVDAWCSTDVREALAEVEALFAGQLAEAGVKLQADAPGQRPFRAVIAREALLWILVLLCQPGPTIEPG